ncbi:MAG TPA: universal stress protein [Candidatus Udaeobacter sp.]|nr:universal stress protein [Candidatus Udaeobacter sp.]
MVPVDFSDSSAAALHYASQRAAEYGGSLIVVHVVPADYGWLGIGRNELANLDRSLQERAVDQLRGFANKHVAHDVDADLEVRIGHPAEEIVAGANQSKCNVIVMATHGLTGLDRYLIGSVADRVARLAPCPVFLIPPGRGPIAGTRPSQVLRFKHKSKRRR